MTKRSSETIFHTTGPQTENTRFPNWVRACRTAAALVFEELSWRLCELGELLSYFHCACAKNVFRSFRSNIWPRYSLRRLDFLW